MRVHPKMALAYYALPNPTFQSNIYLAPLLKKTGEDIIPAPGLFVSWDERWRCHAFRMAPPTG
jgi:hypothetical protein